MISAPSYRSFLLRLWREPALAGESWRGEIEYIQSGTVVAITSLEEAFHLIRRAADTERASPSEPGAPPSPPAWPVDPDPSSQQAEGNRA